MPDLSEALRTHVLTLDGVTALIGSRFYTDALPQSATLPAIVCHFIDSVGHESLAGSVGLAETRVQIEAWGATRSQANAVINQLRRNSPNGLVATRGDMEGLFVHGVSTASGRRYDRHSPADGSDKWRYITSQDFIIHHAEDT